MGVITVSGLEVEVVRKDIKNLHLGVYPPHGHIRVAAPLRVNDEAVRMAVISRLGWIRKQQRKFAEKVRLSPREYVARESHYYFGQRYLLKVVEGSSRAGVVVRGKRTMELHVAVGTDRERREEVIVSWYRSRLKERIPPLIEKWERLLGLEVKDWGVRTMKTKWGSCNPTARRIWLNLELAKKPPTCLEYIVVHEMMHLHERHHNERFVALMDRYLPQWRQAKDELNQLPLRDENW